MVNKLIKERGNEADLNDIDTSEITDFTALFDFSDFNGDISEWDVSSVKDMTRMFEESKFNCDLSKWNVKSITKMFNIKRNKKICRMGNILISC